MQRGALSTSRNEGRFISGKGKNQDEEKMHSDIMDGVEATGLGAAGKLTGSGAPPRQEQ